MGIKRKYKKIYKMQHFITLGNAAYKFFKTFRANPRGQSVSSLTGEVKYFRKDRQHTISVGTRLCTCAVLPSRKYSIPPPLSRPTLCPPGISAECFEKLVSSISKGGKMLHFVYFVYIFF